MSDVKDDLNVEEANRLKETLKMQIVECHMLQSMFPDPQEFVLDPGILCDVEEYAEGKSIEKPPKLNYTINLNVSNVKLEIYVDLPMEYPHIEPEIFVRSDKLTRQEQRRLNVNLSNFISELSKDEIIMGFVVAWLQENVSEYLRQDTVENVSIKKSIPEDQVFTRLWIYSHHIYSKIKRKVILDLAHEYSLTGFCLPGKPGIICLEGNETDCEEWWQQVKSMTWKKIVCIKKENCNKESSINQLQRFSTFQEISFNSGKMKKQDHHMDFGEFYQYLKEHNSDYMFKELFGIDGK
ncbi:hypothetical protein RUM44_007640 [Polyplax serrata]|uniref:RWD domain-containing protein n=1 Tax=Polyplax serrata TaxID=468196 RepID=A0ABR1BA55_POLSC